MARIAVILKYFTLIEVLFMYFFQKTTIAVAVRRVASLSVIPFLLSSSAYAEDQNNTEVLGALELTASALKIDTPLSETAKSVSIITQEDLTKRNPQKLDESLRYTAGVLSQPYGSDNDTDWLKVRGFDATTYLDGNRLYRDGYYTWLLEPYGMESIEVVKGSASILYGESSPGGVVNVVQKKPTEQPLRELTVEVGTNNHQSVGFDISDSVKDDASVRYRVVGMVKSSDGELNGTESDRYYFAPSLAIDISDRTRLTMLASILQDSGVPTNGFFPAYGTTIDTPNGTIDPSTNLGEPDYDKYKRTQISVGYQLEHDLNDIWTLSQNFNYGYNYLYLRSSYAFPNDSSENVSRGIVFRDGSDNSFTLDNKAVANWTTSNIEHTVLTGVDLQQHKIEGIEEDNYSFGTINTFNPVYGNYTALDRADANDRSISKSQAGVYTQYQFVVDDQWVGAIGGRYDYVKTKNDSTKKSESESRNDNQLSLNASMMYLSDSGVSPYISYSESFDVLSTIDSTTNALYKPLEGKQKEVGLKITSDNLDGYVNVALFELEQKNALVTNPSTYVQTQAGEVISKGMELEGVAYVTDKLKLTAGYTYADATTEDTSNQGRKQVALIPKHSASVWIDYDATDLGLEAWNFATGVRYVGESKDNPKSSDRSVPSYMLWDAFVSYDVTAKLRAQLNVSNLLDEEYIAGCDYYCYYGQSRQVVLSASYRW